MKKLKKIIALLGVLILVMTGFVSCERNTENQQNTQYQDYTMYIIVGEKVLTANMYGNATTAKLKEELQKGNITVNMTDYGNFEKVGALNKNYPTANKQTTTEVGDIMLYQGNQMVIFYGSNSWSYTRLGKIKEATKDSLLSVLGNGDVTVVLSLTAQY